MASNMISKILQSNAKFAASYDAPKPLMKMREMWRANDAKGTVVRKGARFLTILGRLLTALQCPAATHESSQNVLWVPKLALSLLFATLVDEQ